MRCERVARDCANPSDLGIHLKVNRLPIFGYGMLSTEDREIRRRVFWAAYTWDKARHSMPDCC